MLGLLKKPVEEEKSFYVEFTWLPGKIIITKGKDRIQALGRIGLTMWDQDEWEKATTTPFPWETEYVDLRPLIGKIGLVDYFPYIDGKLRKPETKE